MPSIIPSSNQSEHATRRSVRIIYAKTVEPSTDTVIERAPITPIVQVVLLYLNR